MKTLFLALLLFCPVGLIAQQHEWFPDNAPTGAEPILDPISTLDGEQIAERLQRLGGHYITGRYKIATWINQDGKACSSKQWEVVSWRRDDKIFMHAWRGRGDQKTTWIFEYREKIYGDLPKIRGEFFKDS